MPTDIDLSYCAGVIDSDGCIGIKRSTYHSRVLGKTWNPTYAERITVRQVEPHAVELLHSVFGGYRSIHGPSSKRGRPLHSWNIHSAAAGRALVQLLPFLRIKKRQAENAIAIRAVITNGKRFHVPEIADSDVLISVAEFAALTGVSEATIRQATEKRSVPSCRRNGRRLLPQSYAATYKARGMTAKKSPEDCAELERLYAMAHTLNAVGV